MNNGFYEFSRGKQEIATTSSVFPFTGNALITGSLVITGSLSQGDQIQALGDYSHAEGNGTKTGIQTAYLANQIISGDVSISSSYGNVTSSFTPGGYMYLYDKEFGNYYGYTSFLIETVTFDGSNTKILLVNKSVDNNQDSYVGDITYLLSHGGFGGDKTIPGTYSHAEGDSTFAVSPSSHAEGNDTFALGNQSHAEGRASFALGNFSHAEGIYSRAIGMYSHAEGGITDPSRPGGTAIGEGSHAEGVDTIAFGTGSHAEGKSSVASGSYSHAEGSSTKAIGQYSHAEGQNTTASGSWSHAEGYNTIANGTYQHVQGQYNISSSDRSAFIIGNGLSAATRSNLLFASGSVVQITGSLLIKDILTLQPRTTTPTGIASGSFIVSGSGTTIKPYFWDGSVWNPLY